MKNKKPTWEQRVIDQMLKSSFSYSIDMARKKRKLSPCCKVKLNDNNTCRACNKEHPPF